MNRHHRRRTLATVAAWLAMLLALGACTSGVGSGGAVATPLPTEPPVVETGSPDVTPASPSPGPSSEPDSPPRGTTPTPGSSPAGETIVRAYFLMDDDGGQPRLVPVLRSVPKTLAVATAAMNALVAGPSGSERSASPAIESLVPAATRLLGISIKDGVATVDFSSEFAAGGDQSAIAGRYAQVVYTATQFRNVSAVSVRVEGQALFGPDGRDDHREWLPEIFVDRPAYGAAIDNPARVTGLTRVFEATFRVAIMDRSGRAVVDQQAMAACGTGCWGSFDVTLRYDVPKAQWGTLRVYDRSARDGSPENVRDYPVWLTPAG